MVRFQWHLLTPVATALLIGAIPACCGEAVALSRASVASVISDRELTPRDLAGMSRVSNPAISPDGRWLVWDQREINPDASFYRRSLWQLDLNASHARPRKILPERSADQSAPAFGPDGRLYFLSDTGGKSRLWRLAPSGRRAERVSGDYDIAGFRISPNGDAVLVWADRPVGAKNLVETALPPGPGAGSARIFDTLPIRFWNRWSDGRRSQLFVVPLVNGHARDPGRAIEGALVGDVPSRPGGNAEEIAWSPDGRTIYFTLREAGRIEPLSTNFDLFSVSADGASAPVNITAGNPAIDTQPAASPDGRWLAWLASARAGYENDRKAVMLRDLATGETRELTSGWDRSADAIHWASDSGSLYLSAQDGFDHPLFRVDLHGGAPVRLTGRGFVSDVVIPAHGAPIVALDSFAAPTDFWSLGREPLQLTHVNDQKLRGFGRPTFATFSFKGAGGDPVSGWVLEPEDAPLTPRPVALLVHGGPQGSFVDRWSYLLNPTLWTAQGFAVVSIDFHGSTGHGQAFTDSVNQDWGGKPLMDLKLGLEAALRTFKTLDGQRVCAGGVSYGGYMMNWIEGVWPDRFKCLVQANGVFDTRAMTYETDDLRADQFDFGDHPYHAGEADFERWSPVHFVDRWRTPMLVMTGEQDFRSPYTQAVAAFTALQMRNVPSRFVDFPDEGHGPLKPRNIVQWQLEALGWMRKFTTGDTLGQDRSRAINGAVPPSSDRRR